MEEEDMSVAHSVGMDECDKVFLYLGSLNDDDDDVYLANLLKPPLFCDFCYQKELLYIFEQNSSNYKNVTRLKQSSLIWFPFIVISFSNYWGGAYIKLLSSHRHYIIIVDAPTNQVWKGI